MQCGGHEPTPDTVDRRIASVLLRGKCCRIFCSVPRGVPDTWDTLAQGEMLPKISWGVFPGVAASDRAFPLVIKGKCCPIFRGAPGERFEAVFYTRAQGEMLPDFSRGVFPGVAASYWRVSLSD